MEVPSVLTSQFIYIFLEKQEPFFFFLFLGGGFACEHIENIAVE